MLKLLLVVCIDVAAKTPNFRLQKPLHTRLQNKYDDKPIRAKKVPCGLWKYVQDCTPSTKMAKNTMKMAKFAKLEQDVSHGKTKTSCTKIVNITKTVMSIFWTKNV